jgi:class 3 adenylate cyclase
LLNRGIAARNFERSFQLANADLGPEERLDFRIGINFGDVVKQDGDLFGDGRLCSAAWPSIGKFGGTKQ